MSISICDVLFIMSLLIDVNAPNLRTPSTMDIVLTLQLCNGRTRFEPINTSGPAYNEQLRIQKCTYCNQTFKVRR